MLFSDAGIIALVSVLVSRFTAASAAKYRSRTSRSGSTDGSNRLVARAARWRRRSAHSSRKSPLRAKWLNTVARARPARAAMSSIDVASNPCSTNRPIAAS